MILYPIVPKHPTFISSYVITPVINMPDVQFYREHLHVNYFVCTLGQAAILNAEKPHSFKNINDLIDLQARQSSTRPAVGFPVPPKDKGIDSDWRFRVYSK